MSRSLARPFVLPREFPEGTRFVVEGRPDPDGKTRIVSRYLVFPDGRRVDLPAPRSPAARLRPLRHRRKGRGFARSLKTVRARGFLLH
ncbi:MAG TPA: hypothetical protein VJL90_13515 [Pseudorhodoplanes sp.]|nr:hypothetical protein [Pseudorhodoplanes sp.]